MNLVQPDIDRYLRSWAASDDPVVQEMERLTADASTRGVLELTRARYAAPNLDTTILPLRDGVAVAAVRR